MRSDIRRPGPRRARRGRSRVHPNLSVVVILGALGLVGLGPAGASGQPPAALRVLFVGNSLTATNDLPAVVTGIGRRTGRRLEYRTIAPGGYALEDHWVRSDARAELASGRWDVVVMQQGPSALPESQANLREWAIRFADEARAHGVRPALLTVWPESYRRRALADVIGSYRRAAEASGSELLPAGLAWQLAWHCEPRTALYGADGFHPSRLGTYAAALVVYGRLFRAPLVGLDAPAWVPRRTAQRLNAAAARALGRKLAPAGRC